MSLPRRPAALAALPSRRLLLGGGLAALGATALTACGGGSDASAAGDADAAAALASAPASSATTAVRVGYFPNLTHAPALVADQKGLFAQHVGAGKVTTQQFNAGPDVVNAIFGNSLDISYVGPNPTITAYAKSKGASVRVIAGSTSGGASLVVRKGIANAAQLKGRTLASPQLGNTQDVALRYWLKEQGLTTSTEGGGDVTIAPQKNAAALQAFVLGQIDGAWVPEPYATQFVAKGAVVLVDERDLWPDKKFVTTDVIVRKAFLDEHPGTVRAVLEAHLDALDLLAADATAAQTAIATQLTKITGQAVAVDAISASWDKLTFTADPLATTLKGSATHAEAVGLLTEKPTDDFAALWDLDLLNAALKARGQTAVSA